MGTTSWQPNLTNIIRAVVCVALAGAAPSCASEPGATPHGDVVDDLGRVVGLESPAGRVVSLSPATTEMLFAIGAGDRLVGRTRWDEYPPEASAVPSVGDPIPPNIEVIVATRPDLVVFYASASNAAAIARLQGLGIATASIRMDGLESVARAARMLGALTGTSGRADSLAGEFERRLDSARAARTAGDDGRERVVILSWDNPPIVIGAASFLTEFLELAGARNAFDDIEAPSPAVTIETIVDRDPDRFLILGDGEEPGWARRPEWQTVPAVAEGRFVYVEGSAFSWPSFRALDAVETLRDAMNTDAGAPSRAPPPAAVPAHPPVHRPAG